MARRDLRDEGKIYAEATNHGTVFSEVNLKSRCDTLRSNQAGLKRRDPLNEHIKKLDSSTYAVNTLTVVTGEMSMNFCHGVLLHRVLIRSQQHNLEEQL